MTRSAATPRRRLDLALLATLGVLVAWNLWLRPLTPGPWRLPIGVVLAALLGGIGIFGGLDFGELGLARRRVRAGLLYGGGAFLVFGAVLAIAAVVPAAHHYFDDARARAGAMRVWFDALVSIPLGTVLLEELAFRGTMLGLLMRRTPRIAAVVVTSVLFGLWHLQPVINSTAGSAGHMAAVVAGTFVATTTAGLVFAWLRLRSGSLVAPALAHVATNSLALLVAWAVVH